MMSEKSPAHKSLVGVVGTEIEGFGDVDGVRAVVLKPPATDVALGDRRGERALDHTARQVSAS